MSWFSPRCGPNLPTTQWGRRLSNQAGRKKQKQQIIGMSTREHKLIGKSVDFYDQRWNLKFFFKSGFCDHQNQNHISRDDHQGWYDQDMKVGRLTCGRYHKGPTPGVPPS